MEDRGSRPSTTRGLRVSLSLLVLALGAGGTTAPPAAARVSGSVGLSVHARARGPVSFVGRVTTIPPDLEREMRGKTWRPGCPIPPAQLRLLAVSYWGLDDRPHVGPMVVNASVAVDVVAVFRRLFRARFPIKHVALATEYRPNRDDPNTMRSVTASFNCRPVVTPLGPGTSLSMHSYGLAVDVNPLQNPYVASSGYVRQRAARGFRDRSRDEPGMIHAEGLVVRAFAAIGWEWGGNWSSSKDYMHFSVNGR